MALPEQLASGCSNITCSAELDSKVDVGLEPGMRAKLLNLHGWRGINNPWMAVDPGHQEEEEYQYINLITNPERYTGYQVRSHEANTRTSVPSALQCSRHDC